jgi:putative ABC transport system permease protein
MPRDHDDELKREIQTHLDLEAEDRVANGMSETDARYAALRAFGNVTHTQEDVRALWTRRWLDEIVQDVRYAFRTLRKSPGFTLVAVLTLAVGIGANTAIFSVVSAVILQPLGYPEPEQLQFLTTRFGRRGSGQSSVSPAEYWELTEISQSFSVVGAFVIGETNLAARDRPRRVTRATVNAELLEALAVQPEHGRWFRREETRAGGPALVMLSYDLWQSDFGAREDMVGRTIEVDGVMRQVIGIMPAGFDLMDRHVELWQPLQLAPAIRQYRASHFLSVLGRLKDGVTPMQAEAELASLVASWGERVGASGHVFTSGEHMMQMEPLQDEIVGSARRVLWVLQAAVGLVLLVACANLANLLLVRAGARRRELAVRTALGAGRGRLLRQFTSEGIVLSLLGAALGLGLAWAGVRTLSVAYPDGLPRLADVAVDPAVLGFTMLVSILTGVAFGLVPLLQMSASGFEGLLREAGTRGATRARRLRGALVAAEVALAVVLVVGAGLMVRTVVNLMNVDAGFERSRLVTFGVALPAATYSTFDHQVQVYQRLIDRFRAMPGVDHVSIVSGLPPQRGANGFGTDVEDYAPRPDVLNVVDYYQTVTAGYFETMRIPIVRGRTFREADRIGAPVAVVNETFVRTFWKDLDPVGRRVRPRFGDETPWVTVVGVAKDVKQGGVDRATGTELYLLLEQLPQVFPTLQTLNAMLRSITDSGAMNLVVRSGVPMATLQPAIASAVREADPSLPIIGLRPMDDVVSGSLRQPRMLMHLFGGFAGVALLLAAIGTYGVLSYLVTQRRREIGIRMALGAGRETVLRSVMAHGLTLALIGLTAGVAAALVLTRLMETLLFEVRPNDPATLAGVAALITAVAAAASLVPAFRATRVDPIVALREE